MREGECKLYPNHLVSSVHDWDWTLMLHRLTEVRRVNVEARGHLRTVCLHPSYAISRTMVENTQRKGTD